MRGLKMEWHEIYIDINNKIDLVANNIIIPTPKGRFTAAPVNQIKHKKLEWIKGDINQLSKLERNTFKEFYYANVKCYGILNNAIQFRIYKCKHQVYSCKDKILDVFIEDSWRASILLNSVNKGDYTEMNGNGVCYTQQDAERSCEEYFENYVNSLCEV